MGRCKKRRHVTGRLKVLCSKCRVHREEDRGGRATRSTRWRLPCPTPSSPMISCLACDRGAIGLESRWIFGMCHASILHHPQCRYDVVRALLCMRRAARRMDRSVAVACCSTDGTKPMTPPEIRYARSSDLRIAYQVVGTGPLDLVFVPGFVSNIDLLWEMPEWASFYSRLAAFSRLILFDKRGTGLSDRIAGIANLEERMDDVRAVLDAVGSQRAALFGISEGGPMSLLFAATYPQRVQALVLYGSYARHPLLTSEEYLAERSRSSMGDGRIHSREVPAELVRG
jgi:alpha/beta hydrolase fold